MLHAAAVGALDGLCDFEADDINDDDTIVGESGDRGFVLGSCHAQADSFAYGVNDAGTIVGCIEGRAVRCIDKKPQYLGDLVNRKAGWSVSCAHGINRSGTIVGRANRSDTGSLPVRLVPI